MDTWSMWSYAQVKGIQVKGSQVRGSQVKGSQVKGSQVKGSHVKLCSKGLVLFLPCSSQLFFQSHISLHLSTSTFDIASIKRNFKVYPHSTWQSDGQSCSAWLFCLELPSHSGVWSNELQVSSLSSSYPRLWSTKKVLVIWTLRAKLYGTGNGLWEWQWRADGFQFRENAELHLAADGKGQK